MEKISAACAMEWSIQLDRALRSNNSACAVEAILQTGSRLEKWRQEPEATKAVCSIFGLVLGEDRLFANTILLRLADAFQSGDRNIRLAVVRIFLRNIRSDRSQKNRKQIRATFLKGRVHNQAELLRRVKVVFDTGDVESRALALALFGCWADFAKDSAQIRYLVLSSMVSSHVLEVKASLFAAGCFCELANDFASVALEMLVNMLASSETLPAIRLAGASVFTRMVCSYSVSVRAYKTGVKLVSDSSEQKFIVSMLVSLSKLVSKSTGLTSQQVGLLLSCLSQGNTRELRVTALRCLHLIFVKEGCCSPVNMHVIKTLFGILDEPELPSVMQCGALQILHQILLYILPNFSSSEMLEFAQLLTILENTSQSPIMSKSLGALSLLTDVSTTLKARMKSECFSTCDVPLPSRIISLIMQRLSLLIKPLTGSCPRVLHEVKSLLSLTLKLVRVYPDLAAMLLDEINSFVVSFANLCENIIAARETHTFENLDFRSKVLSGIHTFMAACLQNLNGACAITTDVLDKVKFLVEHLHNARVFNCYTRTIYSLLLHSPVVGTTIEKPFKHELTILEHASKMLSERDNWHAYKAGAYAACQGAWITATFIFEQLMTRVQSNSCYFWLESLVQFSYSESQIQVSLLPKQQSVLVGSMDMNELVASLKGNLQEVGSDAEGNHCEPDYREVLVGAYRNLSSSIETLGTVIISRKEFWMQKWFLTIRAKFLCAAMEIFEVTDTYKEENVSNIVEVQNSDLANRKHLQKFTQLSFWLMRLAKELDLISSSLIGIDGESSKIIGILALSCSVLAFTAGFPCFFPNIPGFENLEIFGLDDSKQNKLRSMILQDLLGRLLHIDHEISMNLCLLLDNGGYPKRCFHLQSRNQILGSENEIKDILDIIKYAVSIMVCLHSEPNKMETEVLIPHLTKNGTELLIDIIKKLFQIPFQIPKHFFKIRPLIGSELFIFHSNSGNQDGIAVLPGCHLSLNLCIQLRNAPAEFLLRLTKLYCLLHCKVSFQKPSHSETNSEQTERDSQPWESEDMVEMSEKLYHHVIECTKKTGYSNGKRCRDDDQVVNGFVHFEPTAKGQGFSNCVLDVSQFPVGCYIIKWYSCCIDNEGNYWSLLPLKSEPVFTVQQSNG